VCASSPTNRTRHSYKVHGLLTVKGVTGPIVLDARYELENDLQIRATARLNRREFGMTFNNLALLVVFLAAGSKDRPAGFPAQGWTRTGVQVL
jgi:polyisoprenoid-binding protein YceI